MLALPVPGGPSAVALQPRTTLMLRFSSDAIEPRERIEFWDDLLVRTLTPFRTEPAGEHAFRV
jgi:hypothetical protein